MVEDAAADYFPVADVDCCLVVVVEDVVAFPTVVGADTATKHLQLIVVADAAPVVDYLRVCSAVVDAALQWVATAVAQLLQLHLAAAVCYAVDCSLDDFFHV